MVERVRLLLNEALRQDSIKRYFLMFGGGLFAPVTPCSCPVLPLTVGHIGNKVGESRWEVFLLSLSLIAGTFAGFLSRLPKARVWMEGVKTRFALPIILTVTLLFVFVGQHTDFPDLTRMFAGSHSPAPQQTPQEPKLVAATALPPRATERTSETKAPDFTLPSLDGSQVTLSSFKGKKGVVLVFFATWCVNCMKEVPEIKKFALTAQKENIEVLAINFKQRADIVERFHKSHNINYRILLDADGAVAIGKYGIKGIPHIIGIDAKGEMIYRGEDLPVKKAEFIERLNQGL
jgi:cytochrome c biogenesis protein CcmG, thiol:disulfide interchange protein DsbE